MYETIIRKKGKKVARLQAHRLELDIYYTVKKKVKIDNTFSF